MALTRSSFDLFTHHSPASTRERVTRHSLVLLVAALVAGGLSSVAQAQGLILNLPKDGAWVRFEGTVKQVEFRPEAPEGDISMEWIQHLTLKSVGREEAVYNGKKVPCRWVEIKILTGKPSESGVETGPVGERIYKILVPELRVLGTVADAGKIPFSFLDIVKGFRKIAGNVTPIPLVGSEGAFQAYPLVGPLMHFDTIEPAGGDEQAQVPGGAIKAQKFKARRVIESATVRTTCEAEFLRCDPEAIPFALAKWTTKTTIEHKDSTAARSTAFKPATQVNVEMSAHEWGAGAKSEINSP
jgi:hypothetical protein